jgi:hypothetical protein
VITDPKQSAASHAPTICSGQQDCAARFDDGLPWIAERSLIFRFDLEVALDPLLVEQSKRSFVTRLEPANNGFSACPQLAAPGHHSASRCADAAELGVRYIVASASASSTLGVSLVRISAHTSKSRRFSRTTQALIRIAMGRDAEAIQESFQSIAAQNGFIALTA